MKSIKYAILTTQGRALGHWDNESAANTAAETYNNLAIGGPPEDERPVRVVGICETPEALRRWLVTHLDRTWAGEVIARHERSRTRGEMFRSIEEAQAFVRGEIEELKPLWGRYSTCQGQHWRRVEQAEERLSDPHLTAEARGDLIALVEVMKARALETDALIMTTNDPELSFYVMGSISYRCPSTGEAVMTGAMSGPFATHDEAREGSRDRLPGGYVVNYVKCAASLRAWRGRWLMPEVVDLLESDDETLRASFHLFYSFASMVEAAHLNEPTRRPGVRLFERRRDAGGDS